jgi:hypothetical protein
MSVPTPESNVPPPQFAEYPRARVESGSADRLQALADGYFGLNWIFAANMGGWILFFILVGVAGAAESSALMVAALLFGYLGFAGRGRISRFSESEAAGLWRQLDD